MQFTVQYTTVSSELEKMLLSQPNSALEKRTQFFNTVQGRYRLEKVNFCEKTIAAT